MKLPTPAANFHWMPESPPRRKSPSPAKKAPSPNKYAAHKAVMRKVLAIRKGNVFSNRVGQNYALTKPVVTWSSTATSVGETIDLSSLAKMVTVPGKYAVTEVAGFQSAGTKLPHFRETLNKPAVGKINSTVTFVKLNMVFLEPNQTASVRVFKSGKILILSNGPWERVARILVKHYLPGKMRLMVDNAGETNYQTKFFCDHNIDTSVVYNAIDKKKVSGFGFSDASEIDEYVKKQKKQIPTWKPFGGSSPVKAPSPVQDDVKGFKKTKVTISTKSDPKVVFNLFANGTVVVMKSAKMRDGPDAFKSLARQVGIDMFYVGKKAAPAPKLNMAAYIANYRYDLAPGWNASKAGFYVRPGPNGKPRFYELKNPALQKAKTIRAYLNAKLNIPTNTRTKLGITNANVAGIRNKAPSAGRPSGWNNQSRNGHYVKPNKSGNPQWYQIPKLKSAARNTVIEAYGKHAVPIPQHIRNMFKIGNNVKSVPLASPVIGKKTTKKQLMNMAVMGNIPQVTEKLTVAQMKQVLQKKLSPQNKSVDVVVNGVNHTFLANGSVRRVYPNKASRTRKFDTLKANEQDAIARAYMSSKRYEEYKKVARKDKFKFLKNLKNRGAKHSPKSPGSTPGSASLNNFAKNVEKGMKNKSPSPNGFMSMPRNVK